LAQAASFCPGSAGFKPADPGQNEEAWAKNRRDEFVLSK